MPYFNNNNGINILLIHIPKTGGSSLEKYFSNKFNIPLSRNSLYLENIDDDFLYENNIAINTSLQHMSYQSTLKYTKEFNINYDNITIMSIVRNPYERIISDLFYLKKININSSKEEVFDIIKIYLVLDDIDNHNIPQYVFITNNKKELIPNIHVLHCETLTKEMHNLGYTDFNMYLRCNSLNASTDYIKKNTSRYYNKETTFIDFNKEMLVNDYVLYRNKNIDYYSYLNNDSITLINYFYDYDFTLFNYKKKTCVWSDSQTQNTPLAFRILEENVYKRSEYAYIQ